jgi:hypothetical protein
MLKFKGELSIGILIIGMLVLGSQAHAQKATNVVCDGCIGSGDIADKAITPSELRSSSVTTSKIKNSAVSTGKIKNSAVSTGKIRDGAVTMRKLSPELQDLLEGLRQEMDRLSPEPDLTGAIYCFVGLNTFLSAGNGSADVTANPYKFRLDFTSSTEVTLTSIYDPYSTINIPAYTMTDTDNAEGPASGTYTMIGNQLAIDEDSVLYAGPSGDVLIGALGDRSVFGNVEHWEAGIYVGVRAASCDLL